jgi:hypothetical protein
VGWWRKLWWRWVMELRVGCDWRYGRVGLPLRIEAVESFAPKVVAQRLAHLIVHS